MKPYTLENNHLSTLPTLLTDMFKNTWFIWYF